MYDIICILMPSFNQTILTNVGVISTIAKSVSKWRRSTDGKSNASHSSNMSTMSQYSNKSQISSKTNASNLQPTQTDASMATPVVIRKRKASGEMPFSASKKFVHVKICFDTNLHVVIL
jgi:ribosomal protein S12